MTAPCHPTPTIAPIMSHVMPQQTLHDCPCTGTPVGLHFENSTYSSKLASQPATGTIEIDFSKAVNCAAHALLHVETTGCFCMQPLDIEICPPNEGISAGKTYPDMGAFLLNFFQSHWAISGFMKFSVVGSPTEDKAKIKWESTVEGLIPHFEFIPSGYREQAFNGITGSVTHTDATSIKCGKFHCGDPVGVNQCSKTVENYTETNKDDLMFAGIVQKGLCGGSPCDCSPDCQCPPVRVLTDGATPLKFDPTVAITPTAHILVWDTMTRVYGLLTEAEVEAMPDTSVVLSRNATFKHCCKTQPTMKVIDIN
jgi:hypothetical protein